MNDRSDLSERVTAFRSQQRIELKSRKYNQSTIRASVVSLNGLGEGVRNMGRTINLYRPNEHNNAVLPSL